MARRTVPLGRPLGVEPSGQPQTPESRSPASAEGAESPPGDPKREASEALAPKSAYDAQGPRLDDLLPDGRDRQAPELPSGERAGDPAVTSTELRQMGNVWATRHLLLLLAGRAHPDREEAVDRIASLLIDLDDGPYARRLLLQAAEVGRVADIYPLEVMVRIMEREPEMLPRVQFGSIIRNARDIEAKLWPVGEVIELKVPLNLRMKAFALCGGGSPGYTFAPGPPATYQLEMGAAGVYRLLFRGEVRRLSMVDRLIVRVETG